MRPPFFIPPARVVEHLDASGSRPLREVLAEAGVVCRASGAWTERAICIVPGTPDLIEKEPGDWSPVRIGVPAGLSRRDEARYAAVVLAYGLLDLVARESIRGASWSKPTAPRGRPRRGTAKSSAARQRAHRAKARDE